MYNHAAIALLTIATIATTTPSWAVDGVIDVNQAAVAAGGITPGDVPGFPATLSLPGSYRLTGNLDLRGQTSPENLNAIDATTDNVSIDLNGFSILGPTNCPSPATCTPTGSGAGVKALQSLSVSVTNGVIRGVGGSGITADSGRVERVQVEDVGGTGIRLGTGEVANCRVRDVGSSGISFTTNGSAHDNVIRNTGASGIKMEFGVFSGNFVGSATGAGIEAGQGSTVINNVVTASGHGINTDLATVVNNTIRSNDVGIEVSANGSTILGNTIVFNDGLAIVAASGSGNTGFGNNVINLNNGGNANPQTSAGLRELGTNVCGGDLVCP